MIGVTINTYTCDAHAQALKQSITVLTPRAQNWVRTLAQPEDQTSQIALTCVEHAYTSVEVLREAPIDALMSAARIEALKPGAKIALRKKLTELQVCVCVVR